MQTNPIVVHLPWFTLVGSPDRPGRWARIRCAFAMLVHEVVELVAGSDRAHSMRIAHRYAIGAPTITVPASRRNSLYLTTVGDLPAIYGDLVNGRVVELRVYESGTVDGTYEQILNPGPLAEVRLSNPATGEWEPVGNTEASASAILWTPSLTPQVNEDIHILRWEPNGANPLPSNSDYTIVATESFTGTWPGEQDDRVLLLVDSDSYPTVYARADATEFTPILLRGGTVVSVACEGLYGIHPSIYVGANFTNDWTGGTSILEVADRFLPISVASDFVSVPADFDGALEGLSTAREAFGVLDDIGVIPGETSEPHGFPNRTDSALLFAAVSREFTIGPTGDTFDVWCSGIKYTFDDPETITIPNTTGLYYIHFTGGVLGHSTTYFDWPVEAPVAYIYWNAGTGKAEFFADERHGITLDWQTHEYLHRTRGAAFATGFSVGGYTIGGNGNSNAHAQADLTGGTFFDEDLQVDIVSDVSPAPFTWEQDLAFPMKVPVFHLTGTAWVRDTATSFPLKQGAVRPAYNLNTAGTWSTPDVPNNRYFSSWIIATNNLSEPVIAILGQTEHASLNDARAVTWDSLSLPGFPVFELRPLYKLTFLTQTGMTNTVKASLAAVQDLRGGASVGSGSVVSDHGLLAGLADDDHVQYALADGSRGSFDALGAASAVQSNLTAHEGLTTTAHGGIIPAARQIIAGTGLTGGGDLSADRTLAVSYGTTAGTAAQGDDSRLSDARTPTAHKASHATGGTDALAPSDIGAVPTSRTINGLDLSANRTLTASDVGAQASDADLSAIAALTSAADKVPYFTGSGTAALADFTSAGRALVDDADAAAQRTTLGLATVASSASASDLTSGTLGSARLPNLQPLYGNGVDGNTTISGTTTLTGDAYYADLEVTGTLNTANFRVFVSGTLSGSGTIRCNGGSIGNSSGGGGGLSGQVYSSSGSGGSGATGAGSQAAAVGTSIGGAGGAGGAGSSGAGGASRAPTVPTAAGGGVNIRTHALEMLRGTQAGNSIANRLAGGVGGSGGGGDGSTAGGGGGGGGGCLGLFARAITFTGAIEAKGGDGGFRTSGNVGGGGGGGGGALMVVTGSSTQTFTTSVAGGTGGAGFGTGVAGDNGSAGSAVVYLGVK